MDFKKAQELLVSNVLAYNKGADIEKIIRAFNFGRIAHEGQIRSNSDPYFSHCIAVAEILIKKYMDVDTIVTALLHDTVEDTDVTIKDIEKNFGIDVASLVNGVTKLKVIGFHNNQTKQAENFRKLLLAMSNDIRVLLVKLADRIHNIRTLHFIKKNEKQLRIATETMEIYVPLAERIGIHDWKEELEDTCFSYTNPDARSSIIRRLNYLSVLHGEYVIEQVISELKVLFKNNSVDIEISGRRKTAYSIWRKMQKKDVEFEQLSDVMAFRVVVATEGDCYRVLGLIHATYKLVSSRFKDYISLPKANGYKSLHTGVIGPARQRIEVQIRTKKMHEQSELGVAAHWNYKSEGSSEKALREGKNYRWLRGLLDILETDSKSNEFWHDTRMEMYTDQIFAFTPKNEIIDLPNGSCLIDFAYAIHSKVGDKTTGARINNKIMPLKTIIQNGDQVEILTQSNAEPKADWENFVVSGKARSALRKYFRAKNSNDYIETGKVILAKAFKLSNFELQDKDIEKLREKYKYSDRDKYLSSIGDGTRGVNEALYTIHPDARANKKKKEISPVPLIKGNVVSKRRTELIKGLLPDIIVRFPKCCHAVPGDRIVGIVHTGQGVSIHNVNCNEIKQYEEFHNQWLDVSWHNNDSDQVFIARINVVFSNHAGTLSEITSEIAHMGANIYNLKILNRSDDYWDINIDVEVQSVSRLIELMVKLRMLVNVLSVNRV